MVEERESKGFERVRRDVRVFAKKIWTIASPWVDTKLFKLWDTTFARRMFSAVSLAFAYLVDPIRHHDGATWPLLTLAAQLLALLVFLGLSIRSKHALAFIGLLCGSLGYYGVESYLTWSFGVPPQWNEGAWRLTSVLAVAAGLCVIPVVWRLRTIPKKSTVRLWPSALLASGVVAALSNARGADLGSFVLSTVNAVCILVLVTMIERARVPDFFTTVASLYPVWLMLHPLLRVGQHPLWLAVYVVVLIGFKAVVWFCYNDVEKSARQHQPTPDASRIVHMPCTYHRGALSLRARIAH